MKKIVIARHGECGFDFKLNTRGEVQMALLAKELEQRIGGGKILILSSPVNRARESAAILSSHFRTDVRHYHALWSGCDQPVDLLTTLNLVRKHKENTDALILVTHLEFTEQFPKFFAENELEAIHDSIDRFHGVGLNNGQAWMIDCYSMMLELVTTGCHLD